MISQPVKDLYYVSLGKLSALSFLLCRLRGTGRFLGGFVNIGCGRNYVSGMINVDGNIMCKKDLWLDVTLGLPFPDNSIQGIYASHMIEHLRLKRVRKLFAEFHRVLKPGARVRLVVPSLEYAIEAYLRRDETGLPHWPENLDSPGGRFNNLMLCANQHSMLFDYSLLQELLAEPGFISVLREAPLQSAYFGAEHMQFESDPALKDRSLHVEAIK